MSSALLDTDTLSEVIKGKNATTVQRAAGYLAEHGAFQFSLITRYEILRGLKAKKAGKQLQAFEDQCNVSRVLPISDEIVVLAAEYYARLRSSGQIIGDADLFIAATAYVHGLVLVTNNLDHFRRIREVPLESWS